MPPDSTQTFTARGERASPEADAWNVLLGVVERLRTRGVVGCRTGFRLDSYGACSAVEPEGAWVVADPEAPRRWTWPPTRSESRVDPPSVLSQLLDLYMPLCVGASAQSLVVAHLAQSLDGRVATCNGASQFISGREDLIHTHRMRALFDAVVVGASTIEKDDPQLTTRLVAGTHPTRVIIDPNRRLRADHRVFRDQQAPTLVIVGRGRNGHNRFRTPHVTEVDLETHQGWIPVEALLRALAERGLRRVFVEGGGITVSRFVEAGALDRLHVTVAPLIIGSGRPAFALPEIDDLASALQLQCRHFSMGRDILFDCPLKRSRIP